MAKDPLAVSARCICKGFKTFWGKRQEILHDISLQIEQEEVFGVLGPNGSGKTTLLSIFSTLAYPDSGELWILGHDARKKPGDVRSLINISTGKPNFPWSLTVRENLTHYAMLYGLHGRELRASVDEVMESFSLFEHETMRFENLSTGQKQRLSLAKAMLNHPKLLFLDEPTAGLDPQMSLRTRELVKRIHGEGVSVVLTTHYMPEAESLCERIAFLRQGRVVALDSPRQLKRQLKLGERMTIRYRGDVDTAALARVPGVICAECSAGRSELVLDREEKSLSQIMRIFASAEICDLKLEEPNLEDVFIELAG
ncbi:MAG: Trehalose/maltose import ATP-binding protein MalK [Methanosaeta sp. PtaB.Bin039]|nr:MAG: Trehalose/maltose import ATP-binding protein MalK [Methanosaeta sp. PtaB.Bin039]HQF15862.1 ABC transporter ATP-binding protein [Methanotrichaceae archaeon]HQI90462.1 ABC transporter ATP-binding protein [Methanotrichaceae archaeon]HQJ28149.1 ABC transporter ATP-binding protein [Methanotrichaceae archaeon]